MNKLLIKYIEVQSYLHEKQVLPPLLLPNEAAELCRLPEKRLIELAESKVAPCVFIDGRGPFFFKRDIIAWVKDNLLTIQEGRSFCKPLVVYSDSANARGLPKGLLGVAELLFDHGFAPVPGVYFLIKEGEVVYVGQSRNVSLRIAQHLDLGKSFERVLYMRVPENELVEVECAFIHALRPKLNMNNGRLRAANMTPERIQQLMCAPIKSDLTTNANNNQNAGASPTENQTSTDTAATTQTA